MKQFSWFGPGDMPDWADLRLHGWTLMRLDMGTLAQSGPHGGGFMFANDSLLSGGDLPDHPILFDATQARTRLWRELLADHARPRRQRMIAVGVRRGRQRGWLLGRGFGDAMPLDDPAPGALRREIVARAENLANRLTMLERWRRLGALRLDLLMREGYVEAEPLGLNPREFALLWRLMACPQQPVDKVDLLRDVWQLRHVPETNSVAVHASRLRAKLVQAGLHGWLKSTPGGGYVLTPDDGDYVLAAGRG
ncbi:hypothetical protein GTZ99_11325 [Novosphingobium sp. FSY-8]|uniref:OmpR/PhoB-type domain-containing protein n=1 Tax=Novosphingobium ovatum TaxID=1908523 RepID=A0ABW9XF27_9SPHN|nr:winged helix-turn-helix domain-containing protein [Novosphingobium ovatum]NBC37149.1 hypothetical protein [Novosphingobium ovatum]